MDEFDLYDLSEFTEDDFAAIDAHLARARDGPAVDVALEDSPFRKFRKKHVAVTDLVSPLWCELQYEYSLYGQRHKPLRLRPSAFTSKSGKQIRVHQPVARANDQRLQRGKSVHRALEDELVPNKLFVRAVSEEERFGLRLLQLIDGFNQLLIDGITRELPVFAITHAQVVLGVIDEVLRSTLTQPDRDPVVPPKSPSPLPSSSPPSKRRRRSSPLPSSTPQPPVAADAPTSEDLYELRILDYKTRKSSNVPLDEDSLSPRLQLMMYHRMLSTLLEPEAFDFGLLWTRLGLDPTKPFSHQFLKDILWDQRRAAPSDSVLDLDRLVTEWTSTVQQNRARVLGVSPQLQIVYRRSVYAARRDKGKRKVAETLDMDDPLAALAFQQDLDLARAIEQSLREMGHQEATKVAHLVAQNVKQAGPSSVGRASAVWKDLVSPDPEQCDPMLAWAIQESLLHCADEAHTRVSSQPNLDTPPVDQTEQAPKEQARQGTTLDVSPIIGTKEFVMNDEELDAHIADVLQWWLGARPARGVDVGQTNRCFTCEYRDTCEWREQKAKEAVALASSKRVVNV